MSYDHYAHPARRGDKANLHCIDKLGPESLLRDLFNWRDEEEEESGNGSDVIGSDCKCVAEIGKRIKNALFLYIDVHMFHKDIFCA